MRIAIVILAGLLAGCAGQMERPETSQAQADKDWSECDHETRKAVSGQRFGIARQLDRLALRERCMEARGYKSTR